MCPNAKAVNLMTLFVQTENSFFVNVVRGDDCELIKPRHVEHFAYLLKGLSGEHWEVSEIPAVNADPYGPVATIVKG